LVLEVECCPNNVDRIHLIFNKTHIKNQTTTIPFHTGKCRCCMPQSITPCGCRRRRAALSDRISAPMARSDRLPQWD
jgi:hypothetical protein